MFPRQSVLAGRAPFSGCGLLPSSAERPRLLKVPLPRSIREETARETATAGLLITSNPPCTTAPLAYFSLSSSSSPMPAASICLLHIICSPLLRHTAGMIRLSRRGSSVPFSVRWWGTASWAAEDVSSVSPVFSCRLWGSSMWRRL